jgi:hypothetical protein
MPLEFHIGAAGTIALAFEINHGALDNFEQGDPGGLVLFVNPLKFESVEPDAAATALAYIHGNRPDLCGAQFVKACGALHEH